VPEHVLARELNSGRRKNPHGSIGTNNHFVRLAPMAKLFLALIATGLLVVIVGFVWAAFVL
jgi:hypothetical protein